MGCPTELSNDAFRMLQLHNNLPHLVNLISKMFTDTHSQILN